MTTELSEFSEEEVFKDIKHLMLNERIRPEPEYEFFSKYFATLSQEEFLKDEEILHLINSHGVQLRNDFKYWLDKSKTDGIEDSKRQVPVLDSNNFLIQDFDDVMQKLRELPSEWTVIQVTKKFSLSDVRNGGEEVTPDIHITRFACGKWAERIPPYSVTTEANTCQSNMFKVLENLSKMRREYYNLGRTSKKLYEAYYNTNSELMNFIKELESYILGKWLCLFHGRLEDSDLEVETFGQVSKLINSYCKNENMDSMPNEKQMDVIYLLTLSAHFLKSKTIFSLLSAMLHPSDRDSVNASELMLLAENVKLLNLSNGCAIKRATHNPVILILDNDFEAVPWEMITPLWGQQVCRISSLHLLYALYKYHQPYIRDGFRVVDIDCMYCLINPSKDLEACEKEMREFLKKRIPWAEVAVGSAPDPKDLISKIEGYTAYLYCGHGSGIQYLKARDLKKAFVKGLLLLFGCSSNIPKNCGGRTPHQNNTYTYISNGCPCIVGCIQDLGSTDADAACKEMLSHIMPGISAAGSERVVHEPKEPNVLKALAAGKNVCPKYWSKSALVARGIPCKTAVGDVSEITVLKFS